MATEVWTVARMMNWMTDFFARHKVDTPRLDAELLVADAMGKDRMFLYTHFETPLTKDELGVLRTNVKMRVAGNCVAYILGKKEFMDMTFSVSPSVLVPRPDTEILVTAILDLKGDTDLKIADIGTGSGAIILSLLHYRSRWNGIATDISEEALRIAKSNAEALGLADRVEFRRGDMFSPLQNEKVDIWVSNPPYIPTNDIKKLSNEVRKEPLIALDGGVDGLDFYRKLIAEARKYVMPGGLCALEIGFDQANDVIEIIYAEHKEAEPKIIKDFGGNDRVVFWEVKS